MKFSPFEIQNIHMSSACKCEKSCFSKTFIESISSVVIYLLNMYTHVGVSASMHQIQTMSLTHRLQIIEKMQSLNDLKKLKSLCLLGLSFSHGRDFALISLFFSQASLQEFNMSIECKLKTDFKSTADYKKSKKSKLAAQNALIVSVLIELTQGKIDGKGW